MRPTNQTIFFVMFRSYMLSIVFVFILLLLLNIIRDYAIVNYENTHAPIAQLVIFRLASIAGFLLLYGLTYKWPNQYLIIVSNLALSITSFELVSNIISTYEAYLTYCLYYTALREITLLNISTSSAYICEGIIIAYHLCRAIISKYLNESFPIFNFLAYLLIYVFINIPIIGNYRMLKHSISENARLKKDFEHIISSLPLPVIHFRMDPLSIIMSNQEFNIINDKDTDHLYLIKRILSQADLTNKIVTSQTVTEVNNVEYLVKFKPLEQDEGTTYLACFQDLSQAKKIQTLVLKEVYKHMFISILNHQLRTPLNGIYAPLMFVKEKCMDPETKEYLEVAMHSLDILSALVEDSITFSECECGKVKILPSATNLMEEMPKLLKIFEFESTRKQIPISLEINILTPKIIIDSKRLRQILIILLSNALKYTFSGSIKFDVKEDGLKVKFTVSDTGIGIKEERISTIFTEFSLDENKAYSEHITASGFQLSLVYKLVNLMKGTISIHSLYNFGTRFEIVFDVIACTSCLSKETSSNCFYSRLKSKNLDESNASKILIVDDNAANIFVLQKMLKKLNYDTDIAMNGKDCLNKVIERGKNSYRLILMDINMPVMNGLDATAQINKLFIEGVIHSTPIIAVTAQSEDNITEQCTILGIKKVLPKPVKMQELKCIIEEHFK